MTQIYDLYSPKTDTRKNFEDQLDELQSVPDVGVLDTMDAGIDRAANSGIMLGAANYVADKFPSIDNFFTSGHRDRNLYNPDQLKQVYEDAPEGTFKGPMTLLRASTLYDQTTAELRYQQALKVRDAGAAAKFGYGIASSVVEPQNAATMALTAGASSLLLGRYAPGVAKAIADGSIKYAIGKDILDGTVATTLLHAPTRIVAKDYFKDEYGVKDYAEEMAGNVIGASVIHMGSAGLKKAGLWGIESVLNRKIQVEKDARFAEGMGDAYKRAAQAFDEELKGARTTTFSEDANRIYSKMDSVQARYSDGNGEFVFGYRPTENPAGYRGTEPRFGGSYFAGPETLIRAASQDMGERGTMYRVSLSEANPFQAAPITIPEEASAFYKTELKRAAKDQMRMFNTAKEIYAEQGIQLPTEMVKGKAVDKITNMNDLIRFSVERVGQNYRTAEAALEQELVAKGFGGITYKTEQGTDVHYIFDHVMKNAQDLEDMHNEMSLDDLTGINRHQRIEYDPFGTEAYNAPDGIGYNPASTEAFNRPLSLEAPPVDTTSKSYNLQADGILSNGKKIKLDPNGYFDTELMYEGSPDDVKASYVQYLSKEMIDDVNRVVKEGSSRDLTTAAKKYGLIPEELKAQMVEIKLREDFDAKFNAEQEASAKLNDYIEFNRLNPKEQIKLLNDAGLPKDSHQDYIQLSNELEKTMNAQAEITAKISEDFNKLANTEATPAPKSVDELALEAQAEKRMEALDQKRQQIEKAMSKYAPQSAQRAALESMMADFEKEYLSVTLKDIEEVAKAAKVCTARNG